MGAANPETDIDGADDRHVIVLRIAEIFLKGGNRNVFFRALVNNARRLLAGLDDVSVVPGYLRVVVRHPPALERACIERLSRLFGLASMSPAATTTKDIDAITQLAVERARTIPASTTFKVESRRRDKRFPMTSQDISKHVGSAIFEATGLPVDVHHPGRVVHVEVGLERGFVFTEVVPGPGGLPVGTSGHVGLLLSGGIDSPVAGWSTMRRGCRLSAIYFHSFPYTGDKTREKVVDLCRDLARWQGQIPLYVVNFTDVQKQLRAHIRGEYAVLGYRRMMMRVAGQLAMRSGAKALVTGENLGQVASQTLENLGVIEAAAPIPVLRPLLAYDKAEIVERAKQIGTYETSILPYDDCCSLFVPKHPATRARVQDLEGAERGLEVDELATVLADGAERLVIEAAP